MPDPIDNVAANTDATSAWANSVADAVNAMIADLYDGLALAIPWTSITGAPAMFPPSAHGHVDAATGGTIAYSSLTGVPASFAPSPHAATHASGSSDPVTPAQLKVPSSFDSPSTPATFRIFRGTTTPTGASEGDVWIKG